MPKKQANDQKKLINYIKRKEYKKAWEYVKYIGYSDVPNVNERYIIFYRALADFDPKQNNNFILFYKKYLRWFGVDTIQTYLVTQDKRIIKRIQEENISPTGKTSEKLVNEFKNWSK